MGEEIVITRVLDGLCAHPHDNTPDAIAAQLGDITRPNVEIALRVLDRRGLVQHAGEHWQPTWRGWRAATP